MTDAHGATPAPSSATRGRRRGTPISPEEERQREERRRSREAGPTDDTAAAPSPPTSPTGTSAAPATAPTAPAPAQRRGRPDTQPGAGRMPAPRRAAPRRAATGSATAPAPTPSRRNPAPGRRAREVAARPAEASPRPSTAPSATAAAPAPPRARPASPALARTPSAGATATLAPERPALPLTAPPAPRIPPPDTETSAPPSPRRARPPQRYRTELQGLRAVAILMVVCYHIWFGRVSGGVDIFLLISAFLATGSLTRSDAAGSPRAVLAYWARAFKRLVPPAAVVVAATVGAIVLWYPPNRFPDLITQALASVTDWENWHLAARRVDYYATDKSAASPFQHFWSLSIQGQVFLLWPLLILVAHRLARRVRVAPRTAYLALFGLVFAASLTWSIVHTAHNQTVAYFDTGSRLWEFALGSLLALLLPRLEARWTGAPRLRPVRAAAAWAGIAAILSCAWVVDVQGAFPGWIALLPLLSACTVIAAGRTGMPWGVDRILSSRPLRWVGDISYGLYLVHWPLLITTLLVLDTPRLDALQGATVVGASLLLGWGLTRAVDAPVRHWRWASARVWRSALVVASSVILALAPAAALRSYTERGTPEAGDARYPGALSLLPDAEQVPSPARNQPFVPSLDQLDHQWVGFSNRCPQSATIACDQLLASDTDASRTIVGYGNSHVQQILGAFAPIAEREGWQLQRPTLSGCDYTLDTGTPECREWNRRMREQLLDSPPRAVVLLSTMADTQRTGNEIVTPGFQDLAQLLLDHGIDVIAVRDNPRFAQSEPECVFRHGADSSACSQPLTDSYASTNPTPALGSATGARMSSIDLSTQYCPDGTCSPVIGNVLVYMDDNHVTADYVRTLAPALEASLSQQGFTF